MQNTILKIFLKGLSLYVRNFLPLSRAMIFPVFGQIAAIALILCPVYFYTQVFLANMSAVTLQKYLIFIFIGLILMVVPGFIIFIKAFWDYMVVMVSLNTMVSDIIENKPQVSFKVHSGAVKLRTKDYLLLLFILMGIWLVLLAAPFVLLFLSAMVLNRIFAIIIFILSMVACLALLAVISVYLSLSFQVFAFEAISAKDVLMKSYEMIENNFLRTVALGVALFIVTGAVVPVVFQELIKISPAISYIVVPFQSYLEVLLVNTNLLEEFAKFNITLPGLSRETALMSIGTAITMFILPLGSACFTLLYFDIKERKAQA